MGNLEAGDSEPQWYVPGYPARWVRAATPVQDLQALQASSIQAKLSLGRL